MCKNHLTLLVAQLVLHEPAILYVQPALFVGSELLDWRMPRSHNAFVWITNKTTIHNLRLSTGRIIDHRKSGVNVAKLAVGIFIANLWWNVLI